MKNFKRLLMVGTVVTMIGAASVTAFAASPYNTPAEALAGLTGRTVEDVQSERVETGKTYGTIASNAGKLEEFQAEMLQIKKDLLAEKVAAGLITQEKADAIITSIEKNQVVCDGTGSVREGQRMGVGFGKINGNGLGNCQGIGTENGQRMGGQGQCGGLRLAQ